MADKKHCKTIQNNNDQNGDKQSITFSSKRKCDCLKQDEQSLAIDQQTLSIKKSKIHVETCQQLNQSTVDLFTPLSQDSPLHILNSIGCDELLINIFERLSLMDLCAVAEVCKQFQPIAVDIFKRKHNDFDYNFLKKIDNWKTTNEAQINDGLSNDLMAKTEKIFRIFGSYFVKIGLDRDHFGTDFNKRILNLVADHCSDEKAAIRELKLRNVIIKGELVNGLISAFVHLNQLYLEDCSYDFDITRLMSTSVNLKEVTLDLTNVTHAFAQKMPSLEILNLYHVSDLTDGLFERITQMNPQLKQLTIFSDSIKFSSNIFRCIGMNVPELEKLDITISSETGNVIENIQHLLKLKHLESLTLNCFKLPIQTLLMSLVNSAASIKNLRLYNFTFDAKVAECMTKFKNLELLHLDNVVFKAQLNHATESWPHLKSIVLENFGQFNLKDIKMIIKSAHELWYFMLEDESDVIIDENDFKEIVASIQARQNDTKLTLFIAGEDCKLNVSNELIQRNSHLLSIEVMDYLDEQSDIDDIVDDIDVFGGSDSD